MSASVAMQLQGSVLMSMAHITTREHGDPSVVGQLLGTMWTSRGCTELAPSLTGCGTLESWFHLTDSERGPVPHPGSTMEWALVVVVWER